MALKRPILGSASLVALIACTKPASAQIDASADANAETGR